MMLDVVVHALNSSFGESEAGEWQAWPTPCDYLNQQNPCYGYK